MKRAHLTYGLVATALGSGCGDAIYDDIGTASDALTRQERRDAFLLFTGETFGGNGRTCESCHTRATGTIAPDVIQQLFNTDPTNPLFRPLDSDDGESDDYSRLLTHATIRVGLDLPPNVTLADDPDATRVVVNRAIPTTLNTPGLDPILMSDGRAPNLMEQAKGAVHGHMQPTVEPTDEELFLLAEFQKGQGFFSSRQLFRYSLGRGPAPALPSGTSAAEQRGRVFFEDTPQGVCAHCHSGPMLNETNAFLPLNKPVGSRFVSASVSEFNVMGNSEYDFEFANPANPGQTVTVTSPDPGRALITGDPADANEFKTPTLWGIASTAPYFHDNSAATLEDVATHYARFFAAAAPLSAQDQADIVAYLKLL